MHAPSVHCTWLGKHTWDTWARLGTLEHADHLSVRHNSTVEYKEE